MESCYTNLEGEAINLADSVMLDKAKDFAVEIVNLCRRVKEQKQESVLTNQLIRSSASIGANKIQTKEPSPSLHSVFACTPFWQINKNTRGNTPGVNSY